MEIFNYDNKNCNKLGGLGSNLPVRNERAQQNEIQKRPTAEELFEATTLFEADDEITEMIARIMHSILFDDVLDELKETIPQTVETKGSPNIDVRTLPNHGLTHPQISNSATIRKEADKLESTESNRISDEFLEMSIEMISNSYEILKASISEVCQKRATECSLDLLNEFAQDTYDFLTDDTCELLLYIIELFHKQVLDFGNGLEDCLLRNFDKGELESWYDDGFVQHVGELNAKFEQMREITHMPLCDNKIKGYGGILGNLQASKERNHGSDEALIDLDEAENGLLGKESRVRVHDAGDPFASEEGNTDSDIIATELDETENKKNVASLLRKETDTTEDIQASKEINTDSDEAPTELDEAENKKDDESALERDILQPAMIEKKVKGKKYSLKRFWRGVKRVFCCCVCVVERP